FLKVAGAAAGSCALTSKTLFAGQPATSGGDDQVAGLPRRVLGRTGAKVSIVAFPGLALAQLNQEEATAGVHKAFDQGINHFDVAPAYGDAEIKMGPALEGLDRGKIFLSCKTKMRDKDGARKELERSLTRLKTDHFDLYQMHHIRWTKEVQQALGPGGAIETFLKAKEEGKIRYIGFSAHTTKGALEMMKGFPFDSVMFPISYAELLTREFGKAVLEAAQEKGVAVLAMKAIYTGAWPAGASRTHNWWYRPAETDEEVDLAIRFALSQPGVVTTVPASFLDLLDKCIKAAKSYRPTTEAEVAKLRERAAGSGSVFQKEDEEATAGHAHQQSLYPDSPHGCCPCMNA
ncbi:MAG: aldo/keto reductase, partial [Phycisphaerae bacterium]|nr:aldo/keto reductase [Phycisphaerae bacterium]